MSAARPVVLPAQHSDEGGNELIKYGLASTQGHRTTMVRGGVRRGFAARGVYCMGGPPPVWPLAVIGWPIIEVLSSWELCFMHSKSTWSCFHPCRTHAYGTEGVSWPRRSLSCCCRCSDL